MLATALRAFDTMLVGPTKFLARFGILLGPYMQKRSPSDQSIEIDHKTKIAITHPEPIGVCGQMSVTISGLHLPISEMIPARIPWNYPIMMWYGKHT